MMLQFVWACSEAAHAAAIQILPVSLTNATACLDRPISLPPPASHTPFQSDFVCFVAATVSAGLLVQVGKGVFSPDDVPRLLETRSRSALNKVPVAPPQGLFLSEVRYLDEVLSQEQLAQLQLLRTSASASGVLTARSSSAQDAASSVAARERAGVASSNENCSIPVEKQLR